MTKDYINILNHKIYYIEEENNLPKILFIHGFNSSSTFITSLLKIENRKYDIVSLDLPGNGKSQYQNTQLTIELYQNIVKEFILKKGYKDLIVVGHSLGAASAAYVSTMEEVKKVVLLSPFNPFVTQHLPINLLNWLSPNTFAEAKTSLLNLIVNQEKKVYFNNIETTAKSFLDMVKNVKEDTSFLLKEQILNQEYHSKTLYSLWAQAAKTNKCQIIHGDKDLFVNIKTAKLQKEVFNIDYIIIENCGHIPIFEYPQQMNALFSKML